jgi:hypothetical protein
MTTPERVSAAALFTLGTALLIVGLVSGTILRHAVQAAAVFGAAVIVISRPGWSRYAALPIFGFWLFIMALIWLYLLGLARVVTGRFSAGETVLTVVIGLASLVGIASSMRIPSRSSWGTALAAFAGAAAIQVGSVWLSVQPFLAKR